MYDTLGADSLSTWISLQVKGPDLYQGHLVAILVLKAIPRNQTRSEN